MNKQVSVCRLPLSSHPRVLGVGCRAIFTRLLVGFTGGVAHGRPMRAFRPFIEGTSPS